jgi:hypothetical protein
MSAFFQLIIPELTHRFTAQSKSEFETVKQLADSGKRPSHP